MSNVDTAVQITPIDSKQQFWDSWLVRLGFQKVYRVDTVQANMGLWTWQRIYNLIKARTKHINVCHHFIREQIPIEGIKLAYCPTQ